MVKFRWSAGTFLAATLPAAGQLCYVSIIPVANPPPFDSPAFAYDSIRSRIVALTFGFGNQGRLSAWTGSAWTLLSASGPSSRPGTRMAFDSVRDRLIVFGGFNSTTSQYPNDVWEWTGAEWVVVPTGVPGRRNADMAFDTARQRVVLFGGSNASGRLNDTWLWDGAAWTPAASVVSPSPRNSHAMIYDTVQQRTLLTGGEVASVVYANELWSFDGAQWTQLTTPPAPGFAPSAEGLAYDPARNKMYRFGRTHAWSYDGATAQWSTVMQFTGSCCGFGRAVFDAAMDRVVFPAANQLTLWNPVGDVTPLWFDAQPAGGSYPAGASITLTAEVGGTTPTYQWFKDGQPLVNGGNIGGAQERQLTLTPFTETDVGVYVARASNACSTVSSSGTALTLNGPCVGPCYANCDQSTQCPVLSANDFVCFYLAYVNTQSYANCDQTGGLTASDFICFLQAFNSGCT